MPLAEFELFSFTSPSRSHGQLKLRFLKLFNNFTGRQLAVRSGDFRHSRHRTICIDARSVHKEWPWLYCNVFPNKPSNVSSKYTSRGMFCILTVCLSLQDISTMKNVISRVKGSQPAPILLVANKLDLECQREVSTDEGKSCKSKIHSKFKHFLMFTTIYRYCASRPVGLSIYRGFG